MYLLFFLFLFSWLTGEEFPVYLRSEANTLSLFEETVNVQNGRLVHFDRDIWVEGAAPVDITRVYDGGHPFKGEFGYGSSISAPVEIIFRPKKQGVNLSIQEMVGAYYYFVMKQQGEKWVGTLDPLMYQAGFTHNHEAVLRGEPSIYGMRVEGDTKNFLVTLGDGTKRHYSFYKKGSIDDQSKYHYQLVLEEKPNGHRRHFQYVKNKPYVTRIGTTNKEDSLTLSWVNLEYKDEKLVGIKASNGQQVSYKAVGLKSYANSNYISETLHFLFPASTHLLPIDYQYNAEKRFRDIPICLKEVRWADNRVLEMEYDDETRVKQLSVAAKPLYTFAYAKDFTDVKDAFGFIRRYEFSNKRLSRRLEQHAVHSYKWNDRGELVSHTLSDRSGNVIRKRKYQYDKAGFITQNLLEGEICRSGSHDSLNFIYEYSNGPIPKLLREKHGDGKEYTYTYKPGTNLRTSKITLNRGKVAEREFSEFDKNGIEVCKIIDDKLITIEPILDPNSPSLTLPKVIREGYQDADGTVHFLKTIEKIYTKGDLVAEEKIYDATGAYCYSQLYEYNPRRQLTKHTNALGEVTVYSYDNNGNKISEEKLHSGKITRYEFNSANQLVKEVEHKRITTHAYDAMGRRIRTTDPFGQTTHYAYDFTGNEISCTNPANQTEYKEYDALGHVIKAVDRGGYVTKTHYNIYGKPLEICYPDGTKKSFVYDVYGNLIQETERDGSYTTYELDERDRPTVTKLFATDGTLLKTLYKHYKGPNLILEVDALGHETHYSYDGAGRLIAKTEGVETKYVYDPLGHLFKTILPDSVEVKHYDFLDRVIEERTEDHSGAIYRKVQYAYDIHGNRIEEKVFSDEQTFSKTSRIYNAQNRLIKEIDPEGQITSIKYHESDHLEKEIVDPLKRRTVEEYGFLGRLRKVTQFSAAGEKMAQHEIQYDPLGHKKMHEETLGKYRIDTKYDGMGQKVSEIEQNTRKTTYTYEKGRLHTLTKPDGVVLTHTYDSCGRLEKLVSSDGSIHYSYRYDLNDNLLEVEDQKTVTKRSYDLLDRLIHEKQATGFEIHYAYDSLDRLREVQFLNEKIEYTYSPTTLVSASRYKGPQLAYTYTRKCDWQGKPLTGSLDGLDIAFTWDKSGQILKIASAPFTQECFYDAVGNLSKTSVEDPLGCYEENFTYDDLDQLTEEKGPFSSCYGYDSLHNRRVKDEITYTIDHLNQVTQGTSKYSYDLVGRRESQDQTHYTYDALGRLISCHDICYSYDPFGRRLNKQDPSGTTQYIYQLDTEVGTYHNKLTEFRAIFGKQSAFSIELDDEIYFPLRNHRGDVCVLIDKNHNPVATTRYDAFGNHSHHGSIKSPWLFCGQRLEHDLYHFDKREYDPSLGRWLTPDPLGFADGPNLYAYVHNCPLTFVDPEGLFGSPLLAAPSLNFFQGIASHQHTLIDVWHSPRFQGTLQACGGASEALLGGSLVTGTGGWGTIAGIPLISHGFDQFVTGCKTTYYGKFQTSATSRLLQHSGLSHRASEWIDAGLGVIGTAGGAKLLSSSRLLTSQVSQISRGAETTAKNFKPFTKSYYRNNLKVLTEIDPPGNIHAHHIFPQKYESRFMTKYGINVHDPKYLTWWEGKSHLSNRAQYDKIWYDFIFNQSPTKEQVIQKGRSLMSDYGIKTNY